MHSIAIFLGVLLIGWANAGRHLPQFLMTLPDDAPEAVFWERWLPHFVAAMMLPLPLALAAGGVGLIWWGFTGG